MAEELMVLNYGAGKSSWESLGLQGDQISQSKGIQPWMLIGRTGAEAEAPKLWPPDLKTWFIGKDPNAEKDWRQEEKGTTENEMVGWHHRLSEHEFEQAPGDGEGEGNLACCSPWGHNQTWLSNWTVWLFKIILKEENKYENGQRKCYTHDFEFTAKSI